MARIKLKRSPGGDAAVPAQKTRDDPRFNTALARGLDILRAFRPGDVYLGNVELAERTGIPNSTISRFTYTLQALGYLLYVESMGRYQLGPSVLSLGFSAIATIDIQTLARPLMAELANESGGVVSLGALDGLDMIYVEVARGSGLVNRNSYVGLRLPVAFTSLGWACMAAMDAAPKAEVMDRVKSDVKDEWPQVRRWILDAAREIDVDGFCININGRCNPTVSAVAVPVRSHNDSRHFALNLTAPSNILDESDLRSVWGPKLATLAGRLQAS